MKTIASVALAAVMVSPCFGEDGLAVLKIPVTAEAVGLGGVLPMQQGIDAVFSNPAGLASLPNNALTLTHAALYFDTRLDALGFGLPLSGGLGVLGVSALAVTQAPIEALDENGNAAGSIGAYDAVVGLSWAKPLGDNRLGVGGKYIKSVIGQRSASGFALDLGYQRRLSQMIVALSLQNLGPQLSYVEERFSLPLSIGAGLKYNLLNIIMLNAGIEHRPHSQRNDVGFGGELLVGRAMALRAGYLAPVQETGPRGDLISRLGVGLGWKLLEKRLKLDYSLVPNTGELGMTHRFTVQLGWGGARRREVSDDAPMFDDPSVMAPFFQSVQ